MSRATDIAWAAGFFEGEGCISSFSDRPWHIRLCLVNTDLEMLDKFLHIIRKGSISKLTRKSGKDQYQWSAYGEDAIDVYYLINSYLGSRRTNRFHEIMKQRHKYITIVTKERECLECGRKFRPIWNQSSTKKVYCEEKCQRKAAHRRERHKKSAVTR